MGWIFRRRRATRRVARLCTAIALAIGFVALAAAPASAIPAFAVQTSQPCTACHVGGFGPQLTPMGREFKLEGYTMRAGEQFTPPVSAMIVESYVQTSKDQPGGPAPHYAPNNNVVLDQASAFVAGGIGDHFGAFSQWTYDGVGRSVSWDNLDVRVTDDDMVWGHDVRFGIDFNNSPSVQDVWNTLPAWGFFYTNSALAPSPAAAPVLDGTLAQLVTGTSVYAWADMSYYAEIGVYWTPSHGSTRAMGVDPAGDFGTIAGAAPYFRLAYQQDNGPDNWEVGLFGFFPSIHPFGDRTTGTSDHYDDVGIDASYQYIGDNNNIYQVNARYIYESQSFDATALLGGATHLNDSLNEVKVDGSYYWHNTLGGTVSLFDTWGSTDPLLYAANTALKPDSQGMLFQIDATPFGGENDYFGRHLNLRVGLQYTVYTKFDGSSHNFDGTGRNASDNDTLRVFAWFAF